MNLIGPLLIISILIAWVASWVTHVIVCIQKSEWILLIVGILVPPIGWVHGVGVWFGAF